MYDNVIKENIRRFRKAKGYTQAKMAELLGISVTYYRSIESGDAVLLKHIIEDIAELFEVRVESILNRFGNYMEGIRIFTSFVPVHMQQGIIDG